MQTATHSTRWSILFLALLGISSAVLTEIKVPKSIGFFFVGMVFGVAVSAYFAVVEGQRSPLRLMAFIAACTTAFPVSIWAGVPILNVFPLSDSSRDIPIPVLFVGGFVGASVVLVGGMFAFGPRPITWASLGKALLWSIAGGFLGAAGGVMGRLLGMSDSFRLLSFIWQPGIALSLGLLVTQKSQPLPAQSANVISVGNATTATALGIRIVRMIFFAAVLCVLGLMAAVEVQKYLR